MIYVLIPTVFAVFLVLGCPDVAAYMGLPLWLRSLAYHWLHANIFHLAANMLSAWFIFHPKRKDNTRTCILAFILATLSYFVAVRPVVGISNMLFAAIGIRTPSMDNHWWRSPRTQTFFIVTIAMLALPQFSAITHIVSFVLGSLTASALRTFKRTDDDIRRATEG